MREVSKNEWIKSARSGDIGLIRAKNLFSTMQNWYRNRFKEGEHRASHGFIVMKPPEISEANGILIKRATFIKNIGDSTMCWLFRSSYLTPHKQDDIRDFIRGAEQTGGHYSVAGIWQFCLSFFAGKKIMKDKSGVFCTEYTSRLINNARLPYMDVPEWQISPSLQLNWFIKEGAAKGWFLAAYYDGNGKYFVEDK